MTDDEVLARLERDDLSDWLLSAAFLENHVIGDETRRRILQHPACPNGPLLVAQEIRPDWVADSPALGLRRLRMLENARADDWDRRCKRFRNDVPEDRLVTVHHHSVGNDAGFRPSGSAPGLRSCPEFVVRDALDRGRMETFRFVAKHGDTRFHTMLLEHDSHHARPLLAAHDGALDLDHALALASDRTLSVRKTLAGRTDLDEPTAIALAADSDERVLAVLRTNDKLPRGIARRLRDERTDA